MAKNILITGAAGFAGQSLVRELLKTGDNIFLVSRNELEIPGTHTFVGDLNDSAFCDAILKEIDTVYYLAGFRKNISVHSKQPFTAFDGNTRPLLTFLDAVRRSSVKQIVYTSSVMAGYDATTTQIDGYVWSKHANELAMKAFAVETDIDVKIVRVAPIYGAGNSFDPAIANFIPALIGRVAQAKDVVEVWGKGERRLQFIYVDDLSRNLVAIAKSTRTGTPGSKWSEFSVGDPTSYSVNEISEKIITLMKKPLKLTHDLSKPDKETQLYSFENPVPLEISMDKGIELTIADFNTHSHE